MSLSLKWHIQLWYAIILCLVLTTLGTGFYFYEKGRRLAKIDQQLDAQVNPMMGSFNRYRDRVFPPRPLPEQQNRQLEEKDREYPDGWEWRELSGIPGRMGKPNSGEKRGSPERENFEAYFVPLGFYAIAERKDGQAPAYTSSNYPGGVLPNGFGPGYYVRSRDDRYREIYHETFMFRVLIGYDLTQFYEQLALLKGQIAGGLAGIFVLGMAIGYMFVSRTIRPLAGIEHTASKIAEGNLSERIPEPSRADAVELTKLTKNLNHTFDQLETLFQRQIQFTANAAHELRTPLTALLAQIEHGLKRPRGNEDYVSILTACQRSGTRIQRITDQLMELSQYDCGRAKVEFEEISLESMLTSLAEELEPYVNKHGSTLRTELAAGLVVCAPFLLEQVITNLINNAIQHNDRPVTITLRSRIEDDHFSIAVADTGKGIEAENLDKLFDRFYQENAARSQNNEHTNVGLGLAISDAIVRAHNGHLTVTSEPEVETVFELRIPRRPSPH